MDFQQIRDFVNPAVAQATGLQEVDNLSMPVPAAFLANENGGGSVTVDTELSETSTNPVENRVITAALNNLGQDLFIRLHITGDIESGFSLDKTYAEIDSLANDEDKQPVIFDGIVYVCTGSFRNESDNKNYFAFVSFPILRSFTKATIAVALLSEENVLTFRNFDFVISPES